MRASPAGPHAAPPLARRRAELSSRSNSEPSIFYKVSFRTTFYSTPCIRPTRQAYNNFPSASDRITAVFCSLSRLVGLQSRAWKKWAGNEWRQTQKRAKSAGLSNRTNTYRIRLKYYLYQSQKLDDT